MCFYVVVLKFNGMEQRNQSISFFFLQERTVQISNTEPAFTEVIKILNSEIKRVHAISVWWCMVGG